jgi:hypothetical protein
MPKIQMTVIPEPEEGTAAVLAPVPNFAEANSYTVMSGSADTDYIVSERKLKRPYVTEGYQHNIDRRCSN